MITKDFAYRVVAEIGFEHASKFDEQIRPLLTNTNRHDELNLEKYEHQYTCLIYNEDLNIVEISDGWQPYMEHIEVGEDDWTWECLWYSKMDAMAMDNNAQVLGYKFNPK
jgi:hypothetical protein